VKVNLIYPVWTDGLKKSGHGLNARHLGRCSAIRMAERIAGRAQALLAICPQRSHLRFMEREPQLESTNERTERLTIIVSDPTHR
jgi:hypothetical protein